MSQRNTSVDDGSGREISELGVLISEFGDFSEIALAVACAEIRRMPI